MGFALCCTLESLSIGLMLAVEDNGDPIVAIIKAKGGRGGRPVGIRAYLRD